MPQRRGCACPGGDADSYTTMRPSLLNHGSCSGMSERKPRTCVRGYCLSSLRDFRCRCVLETTDLRPWLLPVIASRLSVPIRFGNHGFASVAIACRRFATFGADSLWKPRTCVRGYCLPSLRDFRCEAVSPVICIPGNSRVSRTRWRRAGCVGCRGRRCGIGQRGPRLALSAHGVRRGRGGVNARLCRTPPWAGVFWG